MTLAIHPDRIVPTLGILCGFLTISYIALIVTTIFFASVQSQSVDALRNTEGMIGNLESSYYSTINKDTSIDPSSLGFVSPTDVQYVAAVSNASNLTYAGN